MFRASSVHLQEDTIVYMQHMVLSQFVLACRFSLKLCTNRPPRTLIQSDSTKCCICTTVSSYRWALDARNM